MTIDSHLTDAELDAVRGGATLPGDRLTHAEDCPRCQASIEGFENTWKLLGEVVPAHDGELWGSISDALDRDPHPRRLPGLALMAAAAVLVVALGVWGVARMRSLEQGRTERLAAGIELFDAQQAAAGRLAAVLALETGEQSVATLRPLLDVLEGDPDEHVRIAALDVASEAILAGRVPQARLLTILRYERSPVVQSDLVDLLLRSAGPEVVPSLRRALPPDTHPFVLAQLPART